MQYTGIFSDVLLMEGENTDTIGALLPTRWRAPSGVTRQRGTAYVQCRVATYLLKHPRGLKVKDGSNPFLHHILVRVVPSRGLIGP